MNKLNELKELLCKELDEYARRGDLTSESLCKIDMLAHAAKNIGKLIEQEEGGYSMTGGGSYAYEGGNSMGGRSYEGGSSNRGGSYADGSSYARGRMNARRDSMGRYSREGGYSYHDGMEDIIEDLRGMTGSMPEEKRRKVERMISELER